VAAGVERDAAGREPDRLPVDVDGGAEHVDERDLGLGPLDFDMAGNVYSLSLGAGKASDPWGPATGTNKVVRGGGFNSDAKYLRAANREPATGPQAANTSFRCVRSK
jgi:hypothetical protein